MKAYRRNGGAAPLIVNVTTRWIWVLSISPPPFCRRGWAFGVGCAAGAVWTFWRRENFLAYAVKINNVKLLHRYCNLTIHSYRFGSLCTAVHLTLFLQALFVAKESDNELFSIAFCRIFLCLSWLDKPLESCVPHPQWEHFALIFFTIVRR